MKFLLVIAGLCGVGLAGGSEVRNQDYGQHGSQVFSQQHNTFSGDNHRGGNDGKDGKDGKDGGFGGNGNNRKAWEWQTRSFSNNYDNRDRVINQNQVGFIPSVNQNYYNGGYSVGYSNQQGFVPQSQPTYPAYVAQQQFYPTVQPTYQTVSVVDPNQYSYGYYNDPSGNVYQYQDSGIYNYGPSTVVSQTYSYLPISYNQVETFANQQGWNFHKFGSDDEAKKFNDHYRNRRGGQGSGFGNDHQGSGFGNDHQGSGFGNDHQGSGFGNDHQGSGFGNDHQGSGFGNDHQGSGSGYGSGHAIAYGVDVGSANLRKDGGRDGKY